MAESDSDVEILNCVSTQAPSQKRGAPTVQHPDRQEPPQRQTTTEAVLRAERCARAAEGRATGQTCAQPHLAAPYATASEQRLPPIPSTVPAPHSMSDIMPNVDYHVPAFLSGTHLDVNPLLRALPPSIAVSQPPPLSRAALEGAFAREPTPPFPGGGILLSLGRSLDRQPRDVCDKAFLCGRVDSFSQKHKPDARYGCGYRNIQVCLSYLMRQGPEFSQHVFSALGIPSVAALQRSIELSWRDGFDTDGAGQLGWHLENRDTWIGATDAAALLRFLGFDAVLIDFSSAAAVEARQRTKKMLENLKQAQERGEIDAVARAQQSLHHMWSMAGVEVRLPGMDLPPSTSKNTLSHRTVRKPGPTDAANNMLPWVWRYFENASLQGHACPVGTTGRVVATNAAPLYLQYQGHSTSVVGIERRPAGSPAALRDAAKFSAAYKTVSARREAAASKPRGGSGGGAGAAGSRPAGVSGSHDIQEMFARSSGTAVGSAAGVHAATAALRSASAMPVDLTSPDAANVRGAGEDVGAAAFFAEPLHACSFGEGRGSSSDLLTAQEDIGCAGRCTRAAMAREESLLVVAVGSCSLGSAAAPDAAPGPAGVFSPENPRSRGAGTVTTRTRTHSRTQLQQQESQTAAAEALSSGQPQQPPVVFSAMPPAAAGRGGGRGRYRAPRGDATGRGRTLHDAPPAAAGSSASEESSVGVGAAGVAGSAPFIGAPAGSEPPAALPAGVARMSTAATGDGWDYVLLVLDPQSPVPEMSQALESGQNWQRYFKRPPGMLSMPTYQVMTVRGLLPAFERERSKKLASIRVM